jgi:hippurate hydrolase
MKGVNEVYGLHNIPNFTEGEIRVIDGPIFAATTIVKITVKGHGGHGSAPHKTKDPINASAYILTALHSIKARMVASKENFAFTICNIESGSTYNVMPGQAFMQGTVRTYTEETRNLVSEKIKQIAEATAKAHDCEADVELINMYPPVINHATEAGHVRRVADAHFGGHSEEDLPVTASEDFAFFLHKTPGAFFCLGTKRKENETLHSSTYDFNDEMLASGAMFWVRLIEDRMNLKLL